MTKEKVNSNTANKMIKLLQDEERNILALEQLNKTYSYAISETPIVPEYNFKETQTKLAEIRDKIAVIKHAINKFNISTIIDVNGGITIDEALFKMSLLNSEKEKLYRFLQIPELNRKKDYGSKEADYVCRNFDLEEVKQYYNMVVDQLLKIQEAINLANIEVYFEIDY